MLKQNKSYKNDIETRIRPKRKEKIQLNFAIYLKQVTGNLPAGNANT